MPEGLLPPLTKELQGPLRPYNLSACADQSAVGDHIGLETLLPHLIKELQGPLNHLLFRPALLLLYVLATVAEVTITGWSLTGNLFQEPQGTLCHPAPLSTKVTTWDGGPAAAALQRATRSSLPRQGKGAIGPSHTRYSCPAA